ncbi:MAG TPA: winged helix-turn-helix domain-containing protein [Bryobacteraceae bacterium]|nr:winged helix-turn-helix domain-containing protein [Bryobacteraceae bacterium]
MESRPNVGTDSKARFGVFEFERQSLQLTKAGIPVRLQDQPARILAALIEHAGLIVSREDLQRRLWPEGTFVEYEQSLNKAVNKLRDALGDSADRPVYIETVPRRGYRFVAPLQAAVPKVSTQLPARQSERSWLAATGLLAAATLVVGFWPIDTPHVERIVQLTNDSSDKIPPLICDGSSIVYTDDTNLWSVPVSGGQPKQIGLSFLPKTASYIRVCGYSRAQRKLLLMTPKEGGTQFWLTSFVGDAAQTVGDGPPNAAASISPDGRRLAIGLQHGLYVQAIGGGERKMIHKWRRDGSAGLWWHPSGRSIGFDEIPGEGAPIRPWQIDDDGSNLRRIVGRDPPVAIGAWSSDEGWAARIRSWTQGHPAGTGVWSTDGRKFFFFRVEDELHVQASPGFIGWLRGPVVAKLTTSGHFVSAPAIDPTNPKSMYAIGSTLRGETVRLDRDSRRWVPFLPGFSGESVTRSPDGQWLAYSKFPGGELHKCRRDGSADVVLAPGVFASNPTWSPDGKRIAFAGQRREFIGEPKLWFVSAEGGDAAQYMPEIAAPFDAVWSHDGIRMLIGQATAKIAPGENRVKILHLNTGALEDVPGTQELFAAHWSPDERKLLALHHPKETVYTCDVRDHRWRELSDVWLGYARWSPDGKSIYGLNRQGPTVVRLDVATGRQEDLLKIDFRIIGSIGSWLGWTEDWEPMVVRDLSSTQIYRIDLDR